MIFKIISQETQAAAAGLKRIPGIRSLPSIIAGNLLLALGITVFIMPCGLISGGSTGLALVISHFFNFRVSAVVLCINILMFVWGFFMLGRDFAAGTLISSILYPVFLSVLEPGIAVTGVTTFFGGLVSTFLGGIFVGMGVGLVMLSGASTGGTDPIPVTLNRYFHLSLSLSVLLTDLVIVGLQIVLQPALSSVIYGLCFILTTSGTISVMERITPRLVRRKAEPAGM